VALKASIRTYGLVLGLVFALLGLFASSEMSSATDLPGLKRCGQLEKVVPLGDGSTVAAGSTFETRGCSPPESGARRIVIKLDREGRFTPGFGTGGIAAAPAGAGQILDLLATGDGGFLLASALEVVRFTATGMKDTGFADGGVLDPGKLGDASENIRDIQVVDGQIYLLQTDGGYPIVVKYDADGTRSEDFGAGGVLRVPDRPWEDPFGGYRALAVDGEGRVVVAGQGTISTGPNTGYSTPVAIRLTPDGKPDRTFGPEPGGFKYLTPKECSGGFCSPGVIDDLRVGADGSIAIIGRASYNRVKSYPCTNGTVTTLTESGQVSAELPPQMIGNCGIRMLTETLPNGDLIASEIVYFSSNDSGSSTGFRVSRWNLGSTQDEAVVGGGGVPLWGSQQRLTWEEQVPLDVAADPESGEVVAVGYSDRTACGKPTCDTLRALSLARFDLETGNPLRSFGEGGAVVFPENTCQHGVAPSANLPSSVWNRCRVERPAANASARLVHENGLAPSIIVIAKPGPPPSGFWSTAQVFETTLPGKLGRLPKGTRQNLVDVQGRGNNGTVSEGHSGRKLRAIYKADAAICGFYEGCSDVDPTVTFKAVIPIKNPKLAFRLVRSGKLKVRGRLSFRPDPTVFTFNSPSGWFASNGRSFAVRVRP
jgi:hypothetical protein